MSQVYVAIGSNVDAADAHAAGSARAQGSALPMRAFRAATRNPSFGFEGPDFINAVAGFQHRADRSRQLLPALHEIEAQCGRLPRRSQVGPARHGPGSAAVRRCGRHRSRLHAAAAAICCDGSTCSVRWRSWRPTSSIRQRDRRSGSCGSSFRSAEHALRAAGSSISMPPDTRLWRAHQPMLRPPSTARIWPVTNGASVAKNSTARAMSSGEPLRCSGVSSRIFFFAVHRCRRLRPHHRARGDAIDAHLGRKLARQRARQHDQPGLGGAVDHVIAQRPHAVNVDDVQQQSLRAAQFRRRRLRQERRRPQIGAQQIIPLLRL